MAQTLFFAGLLTLTYLIGSFPTAFLVVKGSTGKNVMNYGTGNVGTMNTHRTTGNKFLTLLVLIGDLIKGGLAFYFGLIWQIFIFQPETSQSWITLSIAGAGVILGHNYSIFLKFRGGKGLATAAGFLMYLNPFVVLIWLISFFIITIITKYMVLGQMLATIFAFVFTVILFREIWIEVLAVSLPIIIAHIPRMLKVIKGEEPKLYYKERGRKANDGKKLKINH